MKKTVIVTGAGRGIGRAIALKFAQEGMNVVINCAHNSDELEGTKNEIQKMGAQCIALLGDAGDMHYAELMIERTVQNFGKIDILVNNAGISRVGLLQYMTPEEWAAVMSSNLTSVYNMCHETIAHMVREKSGRIINISSVWGIMGASCEAAYSASKGGINAFTKALAKELAPSGIAVNAIACGAIDTSMNGFLSAQDREKLEEEIPMGRMGTSEEVAEMAYCIANAPVYMTGQIIAFDGGWQ